MNKEEIEKLHDAQLKMMDDIHAFCVAHNVRYYLIAGSALGAVRHGGIIPWDVDVDIAMPRSDYNRFLTEYALMLEPRYRIIHFKNTRSLKSPHALILLQNSRLSFNARREDCPIFIDVFPLDACPDEEKLRIKQMNQLELLKNIIRLKHRRNGSNIVRIFVHRLISVALLPVTYHLLNVIRDSIIQRYSDKEQTAECWCSMCSKYKYTRQCMPQVFYGTPTLFQFAGRQYFVPEKVTDHLAHLYGDYMKLPPIEVQEKEMRYIKHASWRDKDNIVHEVG